MYVAGVVEYFNFSLYSNAKILGAIREQLDSTAMKVMAVTTIAIAIEIVANEIATIEIAASEVMCFFFSMPWMGSTQYVSVHASRSLHLASAFNSCNHTARVGVVQAHR